MTKTNSRNKKSLTKPRGAAVAPFIHSNQDSEPHTVMHQARYLRLFSYKVTDNALSLNQIAPREISDIIWYTFLTSLGCGCVELWNNRPVVWIATLPCQRKWPHAKRAPLQTCLPRRRRYGWRLCNVYRGEEEETGLLSSVFRGKNPF